MNKIDELVSQHEMILKLIDEITINLRLNYVGENSVEISKELAFLAGKIKMHLQLEDVSLYPKLLENQDESIRKIAMSFSAEMGDISKTFETFYQKWKIPSNISEYKQDFIIESNKLFRALTTRILKENKILFPLLKDL